MPSTAIVDNTAWSYHPSAIKEEPLVIEYHDTPLMLKAATDENLFDAWFATWDGPDRAGDIIAKGSFANLDDFKRAGYILHDHKGPEVGYPLEVVQDNVGLRVIGKWHDTVAARECRNVVTGRLNSGLDAFGSIGYKTLASQPTFIDGRSCKLITKLNLYECSFTSLPCNPSARVIASKGNDLTMEDIERWMDYHRKSGRAISKANLKEIRDAYDGLRGVKDRLGDFLLQFLPEDDSELLLTAAREDHFNTITADVNDQQAIEARAGVRSSGVANGTLPLRSAGNAIPGDRGIGGQQTAANMEAARRGKSDDPPTRPRATALEQQRRHREAQEYIARLEAKRDRNLLHDLASLPPAIRALEIAHAHLGYKRAKLAELGHKNIAPNPLGWCSSDR
jgi:HK97 family phage prohead protease